MEQLNGVPCVIFEELNPLPGEELRPNGFVELAHCQAFVTQYRVIVVTNDKQGVASIPILCIDTIDVTMNDNVIRIACKDGKVFSFAGKNENAWDLHRLIVPLACGSRRMEDFFAFKFASACLARRPDFLRTDLAKPCDSLKNVEREFKICGFNRDQWKILKSNEDFSLCASYPQFLIVPAETNTAELKNAKRGRFFDRFPTAVWHCKDTGAVLLRSAQPEISFFGASAEGDIKLYEQIRKLTVAGDKKKFMIMDARSYTAAWANRAKGGGYESSETYAQSEVIFMGLPNIHHLRYSFIQLRTLLNESGPGYLQQLHACNWFAYLSNLLSSSQRVVDFLCEDGVSVLVHCSDGWDRTAQLVSLAKLIADPFYRTFAGFEYLCNREWVEFGHKFSDRLGWTVHDSNERAPVFLQFLDAVHQLWLKNPCHFEFNQRYLVKLAQHAFSGMFGNFLFNNHHESLDGNIFSVPNGHIAHPAFQVGSPDDESIVNCGRICLISVFDYLGRHNLCFHNPAYDASRDDRLACPRAMWELCIWKELFTCSEVESRVNTRPVTALTDNAQKVSTDSERTERPPSMSRSHSVESLDQSKSSDVALSQQQGLENGQHAQLNGSVVNGSHPTQSLSPSLPPLSTGTDTTVLNQLNGINGTTVAAAALASHSMSCPVPNGVPRRQRNGSSTLCTNNHQGNMGDVLPVCRSHLDSDGLFRAPILFEDRMTDLHRRFNSGVVVSSSSSGTTRNADPRHTSDSTSCSSSSPFGAHQNGVKHHQHQQNSFVSNGDLLPDEDNISGSFNSATWGGGSSGGTVRRQRNSSSSSLLFPCEIGPSANTNINNVLTPSLSNTSSTITSVNEEVVGRCEVCKADVPQEQQHQHQNGGLKKNIGENGTNEQHEQDQRNGSSVTCARCAEKVVPDDNKNQLAVS